MTYRIKYLDAKFTANNLHKKTANNINQTMAYLYGGCFRLALMQKVQVLLHSLLEQHFHRSPEKFE